MTDTTQNILSQPRDAKGKLLPKPKDTPTLAILSTLNDIMMSIRARHPEVPPTVLVVGASGKTAHGLNHGHFAGDSWASKTAVHEIMLSGESLQRGAVETLGTVLHECAHALAKARDIQDTSRQGRFHNKRFAKLADELGIVVTNDKKIGWSPTTVPQETQAIYKAEIVALGRALKAHRLVKPKPDRPKTTVTLETAGGRKLTIPISTFVKGDVLDGDTRERFVPVEITSELETALEKADQTDRLAALVKEVEG